MNDESQPLKYENDRLKNLVEKLESEKADVNAVYERDRVLWEQKHSFLQH